MPPAPPRSPSPASPELDHFLADARALLSGRPEVAAAYLYGSAARGGGTPLSDWDVAVLPVEGVDEAVRAEVRSRMEYHDFQYFERAGTEQWLGAARERLRHG